MLRVHMRHCWFAIFSGSIAFLCAQSARGGVADTYLSEYLEMFPTRATQAGNHAFDSKLEDFSTKKLARWVEVNQVERDRLTKLLAAPDLSFDDRLDAEALLAQVCCRRSLVSALKPSRARRATKLRRNFARSRWDSYARR